MLRTVLDYATSEIVNVTTYAATSFYQGAKNLVTDVNDYYHRQSQQITQPQNDVATIRARNSQWRAEFAKHRMFYQATQNKANAEQLAIFKPQIEALLTKTNEELTALSTPYFLAITRSSAIKRKTQEKQILEELNAAKTFASLTLIAQEQAKFAVKNWPLDLLLTRITQRSNEVVCHRHGNT